MPESVFSLQLQNYIGGEFVANANSQRVLSAFDSSLAYEVPRSDMFLAIQAIQTAQKTFYSTSSLDISKNIELVTTLFEYLSANKIEIAKELSKFQGTSLEETLNYDVEHGLGAFQKILIEAKAFEQQRQRPQAVGLIVIIIPAILSFKAMCERLAPALMAGNSIIIKPSSKNPIVGHWLTKAAQSTNLSKGYLNVLFGRGEDTGAILCSHPSVRAVSFAGSLKVAEIVIKNASLQFKKIQVSTTQKNIAAVLADADLNIAVREILKGALFLSGQSPYSIHRVFVVESIATQFIEKFRAQVEVLRPLANIEEHGEAFVGANLLIQESIFESMVEVAKDAHAKVMPVSSDFKGTTLKPVFTLDMTNCSTLQQDDIQAPLVIITTVKYQHEVPKYANVGYYGSTAFLFGSTEKCEKVMSQLVARHYYFNEWGIGQTPMISSRQSFFGDSDFHAFGSFYSEIKTILRSEA